MAQAENWSVFPVYSYISDDHGATEPYTDLPAIGLVAIGILLFGYLMTSAYFTYASAAFYVQETDDLRAIAISIAGDPGIIADGRSGVMVAKKLDNDLAMADLAGRYGRPGSPMEIRVEAGGHSWHAGETGRGATASYRIPICVVLNDATTVPGYLTVTCRER
jgi:hypothetical protein